MPDTVFRAGAGAVLEAVAALGAALLLALALAALLLAGAVDPATPGPDDAPELVRRWVGPLLLVQGLVFLACGTLLIRLRLGGRGGGPRAGAFRASLAGAGGALAAFALSHALAFVLDRLGMPVREQDWVLELAADPGRLLRLLPLIVGLAPLAEEVFLRGYVFRLLDERAGAATAYVVSSVLFGLIHFNPSGFVVYVTIGLVLGFVYRRTANLVAPVVAHACFNALVVAGLLAGAPPA